MTEGRYFNKPVDTATLVRQLTDTTDRLQEDLHTMWGFHNGDSQPPVQPIQQIQQARQKPLETYGFPFFPEFQEDPLDKCLPRVPTHTAEEQARTAACRLAYSRVIPPAPPNQAITDGPDAESLPNKISDRPDTLPMIPPSPHD